MSKSYFSLVSVVNVHTDSLDSSFLPCNCLKSMALSSKRFPRTKLEITCLATWKASLFHLGSPRQLIKLWFWSRVGGEERQVHFLKNSNPDQIFLLLNARETADLSETTWAFIYIYFFPLKMLK